MVDKFLKSVEQVEVVSTSEAAQRAADESNSAAIASKLASEIYEVPVIADSIMDEPNNTTRFLVMATKLLAKAVRIVHLSFCNQRQSWCVV